MVLFAATNLHLSYCDLMRITPGFYLDMVQIWREQNAPKKPEDNFED